MTINDKIVEDLARSMIAVFSRVPETMALFADLLTDLDQFSSALALRHTDGKLYQMKMTLEASVVDEASLPPRVP
jgi:hypothetical protein